MTSAPRGNARHDTWKSMWNARQDPQQEIVRMAPKGYTKPGQSQTWVERTTQVHVKIQPHERILCERHFMQDMKIRTQPISLWRFEFINKFMCSARQDPWQEVVLTAKRGPSSQIINAIASKASLLTRNSPYSPEGEWSRIIDTNRIQGKTPDKKLSLGPSGLYEAGPLMQIASIARLLTRDCPYGPEKL